MCARTNVTTVQLSLWAALFILTDISLKIKKANLVNQVSCFEEVRVPSIGENYEQTMKGN